MTFTTIKKKLKEKKEATTITRAGDAVLAQGRPFSVVCCCHSYCASLVAQVVENLPEMQETRVQTLLGRSLEKEMAAYSSILVWRIPWTDEPDGLQSMGQDGL